MHLGISERDVGFWVGLLSLRLALILRLLKGGMSMRYILSGRGNGRVVHTKNEHDTEQVTSANARDEMFLSLCITGRKT